MIRVKTLWRLRIADFGKMAGAVVLDDDNKTQASGEGAEAMAYDANKNNALGKLALAPDMTDGKVRWHLI